MVPPATIPGRRRPAECGRTTDLLSVRNELWFSFVNTFYLLHLFSCLMTRFDRRLTFRLFDIPLFLAMLPHGEKRDDVDQASVFGFKLELRVG